MVLEANGNTSSSAAQANAPQQPFFVVIGSRQATCACAKAPRQTGAVPNIHWKSAQQRVPGRNAPVCRRSGPGRCSTVWLARERLELVEKLCDVVLNRPDYRGTVLCRDRRVVEARHPSRKTAQSHSAHDVCAEERVAGRVIKHLVAGEHRQDVSREREFQDLDDDRHPSSCVRTKDALSRHRVLQGRLPQRQQWGQAARERVDGSVAARRLDCHRCQRRIHPSSGRCHAGDREQKGKEQAGNGVTHSHQTPPFPLSARYPPMYSPASSEPKRAKRHPRHRRDASSCRDLRGGKHPPPNPPPSGAAPSPASPLVCSYCNMTCSPSSA